MENAILFRAGMKKQRGSLLGITMLLFLVSLSLSTVLTIYIGGSGYIRRQIQTAGFGQLTAWISQVPDIKFLAESISMQEDIEKSEIQPLIFSSYEANGLESDSEGQLILWNPSDKHYKFYDNNLSGYRAAPDEIAPGDIYVSPSMVSVMGLDIGSTITFPIARNGKKVDFTVAGYYEDPFMGSSMVGMKGFLISETDYNAILQLIQEAGSDGLARDGAMLHIFIRENASQNISEINRELNENTPLSQYAEFIHSADAIESFMIILQNAFCALMAAFAIVLLGVTVVILGHSITSVIEQDYKNLGILKAIGFTGSQFIRLQLLQYMTAVGAGLLLGLGAAFPLSALISQMTLTTNGFLFPTVLPVFPCLAIFTVISLLLSGYVVIKLKKVHSITPVDAIQSKTEEIAIRPWMQSKIGIKGFSFKLAVRQLVSGKKRYLGVCLTAGLLVFFAAVAGRINTWLGPGGQGMMDAFNPADLDIGIQASEDIDMTEVENRIQSFTKITDSYRLAMPMVSVNGNAYTANVITEPERFHISQGKTCSKENEIVLTEAAASDMGVSIGDSVTVQGDRARREYTISGIYHCANDMGANIGMSREGFLAISEDNTNLWCRHYFLADVSKNEALTRSLNETYGGGIHIHENTWPGLFGIISAMHLLLLFMYGMTALFTFIVTVMTGNKILAAEQKDMGIYKAIGCSSGMLRLIFALRFGISSAAGAAAGTLLASYLADPFVSRVMRLAGISNFSSRPSLGNTLVPAITVIILFMGFAYITSGRIKKYDITVLTA